MTALIPDRLRLASLRSITTANSSIVLPANTFIMHISVRNNTANAITGGLKFGTTNGGADIVAALAVGANAFTFVSDTALLKRFFSASATQQIFIDTVTLWNSASVDIEIIYAQF